MVSRQNATTYFAQTLLAIRRDSLSKYDKMWYSTSTGNKFTPDIFV